MRTSINRPLVRATLANVIGALLILIGSGSGGDVRARTISPAPPKIEKIVLRLLSLHDRTDGIDLVRQISLQPMTTRTPRLSLLAPEYHHVPHPIASV